MVTVCPHCGKPISESRDVRFSEHDVERFWSRVLKSEECWICTLGPSSIYSRLGVNGQNVLGHVFSWMITNGQVPDGMKVCHSCDNPRCVRPDHLYLGTHSENMRDMVRKKRNKPNLGEKNHLAKLTAGDVLFIRYELAVRGRTISSLADQFHTSFQAIYNAATGKVWKHIGGPLIEKRVVRKLSVDDVLAIRRLNREGMKQTDIACKFGIYPGTVSGIIRGRKRKDVPLNAT